MALRTENCRHCGETFTLALNKPGYIDECPPCLQARVVAEQPGNTPEMSQLLALIDAHPTVIGKRDGLDTLHMRRIELVVRLDRLRKRHGANPPKSTVKRILSDYLTTVGNESEAKCESESSPAS